MKKILKKLLMILVCVVAFGIAYLAGYQTAVSVEQREKAETISKNSVQPTQKKIYVAPEDDMGILAEYNEQNKLVGVDRYPLFTFKEPFNNRVKYFATGTTQEEVEKTPEPPAPTTEPVGNSNGTLLGSDFKLYHYAPTGNATASGRMPVVGTTVAVDPRYIKLGTWLRIEIPDGNGGYKVYKQKVRADDTGGAIKGHVLDIFVGSESEAEQLGVIRNARVYIVEE